MAKPKNPETIIIKNKYYTRGLTEGDIWNYYQKNKRKILDEVRGRAVFFELGVDVNKTIIKRKDKKGHFFYLNTNNYDEILSGRTVAIHSTMNRAEDIGIIDIDVDDFRWAKIATKDVYDFVNSEIDFIEESQIRYTGKTSFHVYCKLKRKKNIDLTRALFREALIKSNLSNKYTVIGRRRPGIPNLDLSSNKYNGGFITLYSLSSIGLPCVNVNIRGLYDFRPEKFRIK